MGIPFHRTGLVRFLPSGQKDWLTYKDLDFKFDIAKPFGAVCMDAKIAIAGMPWKNIVAVSTWTGEATAWAKNIRIQVCAGYGEKGYQDIIFDGTVMYAMPTTPPNIWLNIHARSGYYRNNRKCDIQNGNEKKKTREWFATVARYITKAKEPCDFNRLTIDDQMRTLPSFPPGSTFEDIKKAIWREAESQGIVVWERIDAEGESYFVFEDRKIPRDALTDKQKNSIRAEYTISEENGMISVPKTNFAEVEVTKFLDTSFNRGAFFYLESKYAPNINSVDDKPNGQQNGIYRINHIRHHGHLRGEEWYTTLKAWRFWDKTLYETWHTITGE